MTTLQFILIVLYLMKASSLDNSSDASDESSLLVLKAHILNSDTSLNWAQGTPICSWIGVRCGSHRHPSRATALNLSYIGLHGTIPDEIGNLSFLLYLNIGNNSFNGPIPDTIGNLRRIRTLVMRNNQFSGQIPTTLGKLTRLEILSLSGNQISGNIPSALFNISTLQTIHLYRNHLSGNLPQDIGLHLPNLQDLSISQNQLNGDVPLLSLSMYCPKLSTLFLSFNNFKGRFPEFHTGNLTRLQTLALAGLHLPGLFPNSITNLSNLEVLDIGENNLQGSIPSEIGVLSKINWLRCSLNKLSGDIPSSIFNLSNLQQLLLVQNELSGELPPSIATGLPHLQVLLLALNQLSGMIPSSISNLSRLTHLDLYGNSFSGRIPTTLGNLGQLQVLSLPSNEFNNNLSIPEQDFLTPLTNCMSLKWISIGLNPITGQIPKSLLASSNLSTSLENFLAVSCGISGEIPIQISNLTSLIWLNFADNELVGEIPATMGGLANMQQLSLDGNVLEGSIPVVLCYLKNLYSLTLSDNKLVGHLPSCFGDLSFLRELDLSRNSLSSDIPSTLWLNKGLQKMDLSYNSFSGALSQDIGNVRSITVLDLSANQLSGEIPDSIRQLQSLANMSLSNNRLNGRIPESFSDLKELQNLDLSLNNLSGPIPLSLEALDNLVYFNVSFNELSGEIPNGGPFRNFTGEFFIGNKGLCGDTHFNVEECRKKPTKGSSKSSLPRYILPPVASLIVVVIILILIIRFRRRKMSTSSLSSSHLGLSLERISYYDILRATSKLDEGNLIGRGSFSSVYKGQFSNGMIAAIKVFNLDVQGALRSFDNECRIMRSIRHRNLVKVITSCCNPDFKAIVMEYMPNGNLDKLLHDAECSLTVSQRLDIMTDVANAVEYLHHGYSSHVIHCDLKPSNILLDSDMVAHVADFGIAKLFAENQIISQTKTIGTIGYTAPEYGLEGLVSREVDVYSYGILLMEMFTRRRPTDEMFSEQLTLKRWMFEAFPNTLMQVVDVDLLNTEEKSVRVEQERFFESIIGLALECTKDVPKERPTMEDVSQKIKKIRDQI